MPALARAADPVVYAAGDVACDPADPDFNGGEGTAAGCRQKATSDLLLSGGADAVLALGDLQYDAATLSNFQSSYDPSWGRVKALTYPVIGNHEGITATTGAGYCSYFGAAAHCNAGGNQGSAAFYSFDLGSWHIIVLNSNCDAAGGCGPGAPQYQWLQADLAAHPAVCTLAAWHHPRWSSGHDGSNAFMQPIWQLLYDGGADVTLSGHSHDYERFAPLDGSGAVDNANGVASFVVGTGGAHFTGLVANVVTGSRARQNTDFGVLRLVLHPSSYDWSFVPIAGSSYSDTGTRSCSGSGPAADTDPPSVPANVDATPAGPTHVDVSWSPSSDAVGVAGYDVYRGTGTGALSRIATTSGSTTSYADTTVAAGRTYRYAVRAGDAAGNVSARSTAVTVTTPVVDPPVETPLTPVTPAAVPPPVAIVHRSNLLASWALGPRHARRALARGRVAIRARRVAPAVVRVRVGGRLAAHRRVGFKHAFVLRLPRWSRRPALRGEPVTVTIRRLR
jgi:hypothetical protein